MEKEPKSPRERAGNLISLLVSDWRPTPRQVMWSIRFGVVSSIVLVIGYFYDITLWDWMKLLIVPAVIASGGLWFNRQQQERQREDDQRQQQRGLEIEDQRAQDEALQAYLDQMSQLLIEEDLLNVDPGDTPTIVARARTLTVLPRLSSRRKRSVLQFLYEAALIDEDHTIVTLAGADLSGAALSGGYLTAVNLRNAILIGADLSETDLSETDLSGADLSGAVLIKANLKGTNLKGACLLGADLRITNLTEATLENVDLNNATMPDGQKYENWLKSHEEDGE